MPLASIKVFVTDSKLRKHSVDVHDAASVAYIKRLPADMLADLSLVHAGFVSKLAYQQRMLGNEERINIVYSPERRISLFRVSPTPASAAADPMYTRPLHRSLNRNLLQLLKSPVHILLRQNRPLPLAMSLRFLLLRRVARCLR